MGKMIKRKDGSYSKRGLWDNLRKNKGSGKEPTKEMLEQEAKIKAAYAMGGRMNQAQQLNAGKMRMGNGEGNDILDYAEDYGKFLLDAGSAPLEGLTGAKIYNPTYDTKIGTMAGKVGNTVGGTVGKMLPQVLNMVAPGVGTAVGAAGKGVGSIINSTGQQEMEQMGAKMSYKQGGLMHINEGGTHEQNALGGVPIGPNALVEQGETINNDFVFSDRLKPKGSKKTYAQLSKSVDTKYRLRPDDKLSKEAKQMDLDRLAMQQETQKDEMSTKYMQKAMACGGKIMSNGGSFMGPISQSMNVTNGQNTLLANGGLMSNFMEPEPTYFNPAVLSNQYAMGGYADQEYDPNPLIMAEGGIHIKPENRGKFTASANRAGMGVQEFAGHVLANKEDYSSTQVKRANFARNFGGKKHAMGGNMYALGGYDDSLPDPKSNQRATNTKLFYPQMNEAYYEPELPPYTQVPLDYSEPTYSSSYDPTIVNRGGLRSLDLPANMQVDNIINKVGEDPTLPQFNNPSLETNFMGQKQGNAFDKYAGTNQNPYPEVGNTGYLTNLAGNLIKAGMVATSKPPIYNPSLKLNRMNANPAERLAMQEGRREIQGTKDIIRNNATSSGQYLTNASLMGSSAANKLAGTIGGIRQGYDQQNVGIGNQEAQLNQQITAANNLAKETFRDNRLNQYNKILDSVIGANQQRFATDVHANNFQNQVISLLKTGVYHYGKQDEKGLWEILGPNGEVITKMPKV